MWWVSAEASVCVPGWGMREGVRRRGKWEHCLFKKPKELCREGLQEKWHRTVPERPAVQSPEDRDSSVWVHTAITQHQGHCVTHRRSSTDIPEGREGRGNEKRLAEKGFLAPSSPQPSPSLENW